MSSNRYGQFSGADRAKLAEEITKKKMVAVGICTIILIAMVVAVIVRVNEANVHEVQPDSKTEINSSIKAIKDICQPTDYKQACEQNLRAAGMNSTDPKELVKTSFKIAIDHVKKVFQKSKVLQSAERDPRTVMALGACKELMTYAIDDFQNSLEHFEMLDIEKIYDMVGDLKVWLSAAITHEETCLDGFENTTGDAAANMRKAMKSASELTRNTLAIINGISSVLASFHVAIFNRRLLSDETQRTNLDNFPLWISPGKRRILADDDFTPDVVVAQDGTGKYKTINESLGDVPLRNTAPFIIYIKEGVYTEQVTIPRGMDNVVFIGDGPTKTKITGSLNFIDGVPTFKTATLAAVGHGFIAKNIGVENSAGPEKHQAVAIRVQSDMSVFYNCQFDGYQDTLYAHSYRQFYRDCIISGTIDFIFGDSAVVFQNCKMVVRKPLSNQQNCITAQGRKDQREPTGIVLHNCSLVADPELQPLRTTIPSYLGRPWKEFSRTLIIQCFIDDVIHSNGWQPWFGDFALNTSFYSEFDNRGPGSDKSKRVTWLGIKTITSEAAKSYMVNSFLEGKNQWINTSGIPYIPSLLPLSETGLKESTAAMAAVQAGAVNASATRAAPADTRLVAGALTASDDPSNMTLTAVKAPAPASNP